MTEVAIRNARSADVDAVADLLLQLCDVMEREAGAGRGAEAGAGRGEIMSNLLALMTDARARILVAEAGARIAGMLDFCIRRTALHPGPSALIDELVVDAGHRGRGIGRMLIETAVNEARRMGCCEIEVSTETTNRAARDFYAGCGFDEESVLLEKDL